MASSWVNILEPLKHAPGDPGPAKPRLPPKTQLDPHIAEYIRKQLRLAHKCGPSWWDDFHDASEPRGFIF